MAASAGQKLEARRLQVLKKQRERLEQELHNLESEVQRLVGPVYNSLTKETLTYSILGIAHSSQASSMRAMFHTVTQVIHLYHHFAHIQAIWISPINIASATVPTSSCTGDAGVFGGTTTKPFAPLRLATRLDR